MPKLAIMTEAWGTEVSEVVASARRDRDIEDFLGWLFRDGGLEPPRRSYEEVEGVLRTLLGVKSSPLVPAQEERLDVADLHAADVAASLVHDYIWQRPVLSGTEPPSKEQASDAIWTIHRVLRPAIRRALGAEPKEEGA